MGTACFARDEYDGRLAQLRRGMASQGLDLLLLSAPENIYYLTGLDHWGYFTPHILVIPTDGEMTLITRAMEKVTVANQVANARFHGHGDQETAAEAFGRVLADGAYRARRIGMEAWSAGLPHGLALALQRQLPTAEWVDVSGLVDDLRA